LLNFWQYVPLAIGAEYVCEVCQANGTFERYIFYFRELGERSGQRPLNCNTEVLRLYYDALAVASAGVMQT